MVKIRAHDMVFRKSFNYNLKHEQREKSKLENKTKQKEEHKNKTK